MPRGRRYARDFGQLLVARRLIADVTHKRDPKEGSKAPGAKQGHWPTARGAEAVFAFSLQPSASRLQVPGSLTRPSGRIKAAGETRKDTTRTDGKYAPNFVQEVIQVREAVTQRQRSMRERTSKLYYCNLVEITCVLSRSRQAYIPESCLLLFSPPFRSFTYPHSSVITKLSRTSQAIVLLPNFHIATASDIAMGIYSEGRSDV
jgi:hypothetical protein